MSVLAPTRTALAVSPPTAALVRRLIHEVWKLARWLWPLAVLIAVVVGIVIAQFTEVTDSIWENATQWPRWYLFANAIAIVSYYLPVAVAHGVTRRTVLRAFAVAAALNNLIWAAFMTLGHVVEGLIYDRLGWTGTFQVPHLFDSTYDVVPMMAEYALVFLGYLAAGTLIGGFYYRFGNVWGTALIPVGLLPAVAVELVLSTGWIGAGVQEGLSIDAPSLPVLLTSAVLVLALSGWAIERLLREIPIQSKK